MQRLALKLLFYFDVKCSSTEFLLPVRVEWFLANCFSRITGSPSLCGGDDDPSYCKDRCIWSINHRFCVSVGKVFGSDLYSRVKA